MNAWPTLKEWGQFGGALPLEIGILFLVAKLITLRVHSAPWRRALWQAAVIAMFIVMIGELNGVRGLLQPFSKPTSTAQSLRTVIVTFKDAEIPAPLPLMDTSPELTPTAQPPPAPVSRWQQHAAWPAFAWLAGTLLVAGRVVLAQFIVVAFRVSCRRIEDADLNARAERTRNALGVRRPVLLVENARAVAPFTFGMLRPVIVLPRQFTNTFTPEQQNSALLHEMAHIAGFDSAWRCAGDLVGALLWWHPLIWLTKRELAHASELMADEASLFLPDGPDRLAECLVACAKEMRRPALTTWLGMDGGGFRSALGQRVTRLLQMNPQRNATVRVPWYLRIVAPLLCAGLLWLGMAAAMEFFEPASSSWRNSIIGSAFAAAAENKAPTGSVETSKIEVARLVQDGKLYYEAGKNEAARTNLIEALRTDPTSIAAADHLDLVLAREFSDASLRRDANGIHISKARQEIYDKLRRIRLSEWGPIDSLPLGDVIRGLDDSIRRGDPDGKGVAFIISPPEPNAGQVDATVVRLGTKLIDPTPEQILNVLMMTADRKIKYSIEDYGILISPKGTEREPMQTRLFKVNTNTFERKLRAAVGSDAEANSTNLLKNLIPFESPPRSEGILERGREGTTLITQVTRAETVIPIVRSYLQSAGIDFTQTGQAVFFNDRLGMLLVRASKEDLDVIEKALQSLDVAPATAATFRATAGETTNASPFAAGTNLSGSTKLLGELPYVGQLFKADDADQPTNSAGLHTRFFRVDPDTLQQALQRISIPGFKTGRTKPVISENNGTNAVITKLRSFLEQAGADLSAPGKAVFFNDRLGTLMVRATLPDLDVIGKAMQVLNSSPHQLRISVKVVELSREDSQGLGLDWYLGKAVVTNKATSAGSPSIQGVSSKANPSGASPAPSANATTGSQVNSLVTSGFRPSAPQTASASLIGILNEEQFRFVIHALGQRPETDVLTAPDVTTLSGRQAQIKVVDNRWMVTGLNTNRDNKGTMVTTDDGRYVIEQFDFGPTVDVVPYVHVLEDGQPIEMTVVPSLREFLGYDTPAPIRATGGSFASPPPGTPASPPKFRLRQMVASALVWDGQTVVVRPEPARRVMKKKQINGGSWTTNFTEQALMFFITPRLIDSAGNPIHTDEQLRELHKQVPPR